MTRPCATCGHPSDTHGSCCSCRRFEAERVVTRPQAWALLALILVGLAVIVGLWIMSPVAGLVALAVWAAALLLVSAAVWG